MKNLYFYHLYFYLLNYLPLNKLYFIVRLSHTTIIDANLIENLTNICNQYNLLKILAII